MHIVCLYAGDDGESHFEDLDIRLEGGRSPAFPVATLDFRQAPAEHEPGWHNAPRRQFVITLSGTLEIEIGDGSRRRLGPGEVLLAEDLEGRGHVSRTAEAPRRIIVVPLAEAPRRIIVVPLAEDADLAALLAETRGG